MADSQKNDTTEELINISFIASEIWQRKFLLLATLLVGAVIGLYNIYSFTPKFTASMVVESASKNSDMSSALRSIGAMTSLGFGPSPLGAGLTAELEELKNLLGTIDFARDLDEEHQILRKIYRGAWDEDRGEWRRPTGILHKIKEKTLSILRFRRWQEPTYESLGKYLSNAIKIAPIDNSSFVKFSIVHEDPKMALYILKTAFYEADENIRRRNVIRVQNRRIYLEGKLTKNTGSEQQKVIFTLLVQNENRGMLLDSEGTFVAEVLQAPFVSVYRTEPKMTLMIMPVVVCALIYILTFSILLVFNSEFKRQ